MAVKIRVPKTGDGGDETTSTSITNQNRSDWNDYVSWLDKKGLKGNPILDKGDYGKQMLSQYIKENPKTSLTLDLVTPIQKDFANYRNYALDQIKAGKAVLPQGATPDQFMTELSKLDAYPGSLTTRHTFPSQYLVYMDAQGKPTQTVNKGFATVQ